MAKQGRKNRESHQRSSKRGQRKRLIALLSLSVLGAAVSAWLLQVHFAILSNPGAGSACNLGGYLDCDAVNASRFADIGGVPIAYAGLLFYLLVGGLTAHELSVKSQHPRALAFARGLGTIAAVVSIGLGLISLLVIEAFCVFCVVLYGVNFAIAALGWYRAPASVRFFSVLDRDLRRLNGWRRWGGLLLVGAGTIVGATVLAWFGEQVEAEARAGAITQVRGRSVSVAPGHAEGPAEARLTVFEFSDFECPYCARASSTFDELRRTFGDEVRFVYKHFPLHGACNPAAPRGSHDKACAAAAAAVCAGEQARFWEYQDRVFARGVEPATLARLAEEIGLDLEQWERCRWSRRAAGIVEADAAEGARLGVRTTPSFLIGETLIEGARPYEELAAVIRRARVARR